MKHRSSVRVLALKGDLVEKARQAVAAMDLAGLDRTVPEARRSVICVQSVNLVMKPVRFRISSAMIVP